MLGTLASLRHGHSYLVAVFVSSTQQVVYILSTNGPYLQVTRLSLHITIVSWRQDHIPSLEIKTDVKGGLGKVPQILQLEHAR